MARVALLVMLVFSGCVKKAPKAKPSLHDLLDRICQIEEARQGKEFNQKVRVFGNEAMDQYQPSDRNAEILLERLNRTLGICRGALIQMLVSHHPQRIVPSWAEFRKRLNAEETVALLNFVRLNRLTAFQPVVLTSLKQQEPPSIRSAAAATLKILDQMELLDDLRSLLAQERDLSVLTEWIYHLHPKPLERLSPLLQAKAEWAGAKYVQDLLLAWASAGIDNGTNLIGTYRDDARESVREMALHLLDRLEKDGSLSWEARVRPLSAAIPQGDEIADLLKLLNDPLSPVPEIESLLATGIAADSLLENGWSLIHYAARSGHTGAVRLLLARGADPLVLNEMGESPLFVAAMAGKAGVIGVLLEGGADPERRDQLGRTPRYIAELMGWDQVLAALDAFPPK